ncbi:FAD-dependent monooxygenase [Arthrobacter psychrochitiniphilus]|uniref:FAD-dependent monooxygenase n=2 Tax=Arthrobacter psychrochitiniphilus TaxID=291045 RepID=A0A2V3DX49_9MICC|nr:FAD-dependent monooxygenase [Arthrobacter psychrochitiniphilus]
MFDVVIVGAGPVGLFLATLLLQEGLSVRILEQRSSPRSDSRAIGIHPPALAALALAKVEAPLLAEGLRIPSGVARSGGRDVGSIDFARGAPERPFVLTLKQVRTEALLAQRLAELDPNAVVRGFCVQSIHDGGTFLTLSGTVASSVVDASVRDCAVVDAPVQEHVQGRLVVGADGARSAVRRLLGIPTSGRNYPDTYLMGDFPDTGDDGNTAVLFLEPEGILESFPLPGRLRRWVVHTDSLLTDADAADLAQLVRQRTGVELDPGANSMLSAFEVRTRLARRMVQGRVVLVGDAAHEISPIGGQGMNLGWLDAAAVAPIIVAALRGEKTGRRLAEFERVRMGAARTAAHQAQLNMMLGRKSPAQFLQLRNAALGGLFTLGVVQNFAARRFTMHNIR